MPMPQGIVPPPLSRERRAFDFLRVLMYLLFICPIGLLSGVLAVILSGWLWYPVLKYSDTHNADWALAVGVLGVLLTTIALILVIGDKFPRHPRAFANASAAWLTIRIFSIPRRISRAIVSRY